METNRRHRTIRRRTTQHDRLIEEAIVDCSEEAEQLMGLYTMIEDNLAPAV